MFVGIMKIELSFDVVYSLKDKRKKVNSVKNKIETRYKTDIAEIDRQDILNSCILGLSLVSNTRDHAVKRLQKITTFLENFESDIYYDSNYIVEEY
jgi:uncharacterized protein YlxP (DUF503 family)